MARHLDINIWEDVSAFFDLDQCVAKIYANKRFALGVSLSIHRLILSILKMVGVILFVFF
jgi:hypothetical protein